MVKLFKRRYIAIKLSPASSISKRELLTILMKIIATIHDGEDIGQNHVRIIEYDQTTGLGIVRCDHRNVDFLRSILNDTAEAFGVSRVETIGTSGTLKALRRKFLPKNSQGRA